MYRVCLSYREGPGWNRQQKGVGGEVREVMGIGQGLEATEGFAVVRILLRVRQGPREI